MPIRFRCSYCNRLLGIATRKAGTETICPHCGYTITVPVPTEDDAKTERVNMDDVDELLGNVATERVVEPATQVIQPPAPVAATPTPARPVEPPRAGLPKPPPKPAPPPVPKVAPKQDATAMSLSPDAAPIPKARPAPPPVPKAVPKPPANPDDPPLFEGNVDEILGRTASQAEDDRAKPPPTSGQDAMSLSEPPRMLVISAQKATLLMGAVVVLLALAFAAGYFLAK